MDTLCEAARLFADEVEIGLNLVKIELPLRHTAMDVVQQEGRLSEQDVMAPLNAAERRQLIKLVEQIRTEGLAE